MRKNIWNPVIALLLFLFFGSLVIFTVMALRQTDRIRENEEKRACPYEEYFENQGGGVYHLELDEFFNEEGKEERKELDTTRTIAKIIACWREAHRKEFRIVGVSYMLDLRYPPFIIITEPVR